MSERSAIIYGFRHSFQTHTAGSVRLGRPVPGDIPVPLREFARGMAHPSHDPRPMTVLEKRLRLNLTTRFNSNLTIRSGLGT